MLLVEVDDVLLGAFMSVLEVEPVADVEPAAPTAPVLLVVEVDGVVVADVSVLGVLLAL